MGSSLVVFWWLFRTQADWVSVAFYVWISIVGILLVSKFWSYASHLLDARQAKRLFGFIGAGGILGSIAGGQLARWASSHLDTYTALLLAAALLAGLAVLMRFQAPGAIPASPARASSKSSAVGLGFVAANFDSGGAVLTSRSGNGR